MIQPDLFTTKLRPRIIKWMCEGEKLSHPEHQGFPCEHINMEYHIVDENKTPNIINIRIEKIHHRDHHPFKICITTHRDLLDEDLDREGRLRRMLRGVYRKIVDRSLRTYHLKPVFMKRIIRSFAYSKFYDVPEDMLEDMKDRISNYCHEVFYHRILSLDGGEIEVKRFSCGERFNAHPVSESSL